MLSKPDLICFSHLRWNFVFQRPNHLMSLCSRERRVFFFEEPALEDGGAGEGDGQSGSVLRVTEVGPSLVVAVPRMTPGSDPREASRRALEELCALYGIERPIAWFYTPMALEFARELPAALTVYDCMDELSAFRGAPPALTGLERELFARADLVFTGGRSLGEAKRAAHPRVYCFPSSVDTAHFAAAREPRGEPSDQAAIPHPRLGFYGVIDERMDLGLVEGVARARPDWHVLLLGPVVKIDPGTLPRLANIHYLGQKAYADLPSYLAGWDVAVMPFALNEATRFISPTKTLEYLAGGKPVVSTPIADVVSPYAEQGLVRVADGAARFVEAIGATLLERFEEKLPAVEAFLAGTSWTSTWSQMSRLVADALAERGAREGVRMAPDISAGPEPDSGELSEEEPQSKVA